MGKLVRVRVKFWDRVRVELGLGLGLGLMKVVGFTALNRLSCSFHLKKAQFVRFIAAKLLALFISFNKKTQNLSVSVKRNKQLSAQLVRLSN